MYQIINLKSLLLFQESPHGDGSEKEDGEHDKDKGEMSPCHGDLDSDYEDPRGSPCHDEDILPDSDDEIDVVENGPPLI